LIIASVQFFTSKAATDFGVTLGRGTALPLTTTGYINLANNIAFNSSGGEIALANGNNAENNLLTSFQQGTIHDANLPNGCTITFVDTPGSAGTFYYGIRVLSNSDQIMHHRNTQFSYIQLCA
jgi:hypothetical protein